MNGSSLTQHSCQALLVQIRLLNQVDSLWEQIGEKVEHFTQVLKEQAAEIANVNAALSDIACDLQDCEDVVERLSQAARTLEPVVGAEPTAGCDLQKEEE
jgi:methyl-accepting chemotaxis protein